jgi:hypothetical protein
MHPQKSILPRNKILAWTTPTQYYKIGDTVHVLWQQNFSGAVYIFVSSSPQSRSQGLSETARGQIIFFSRSISVKRCNCISWRTSIRAYTRFTHLCYFGCMTVTCIATRYDNCCYIFCYFATYVGFCIIPFMQNACYSAWRRRRRRRQPRSIGLGAVSCRS